MKRNRLSVIRSSDSDRMVILEQHSYPSVSSIRITHLHRHLVQHVTVHYHLQFIDSLYRERIFPRLETRILKQKGADGNRPDNERSGTAEKWTERKMDEKSRRTLLLLRSKLFRPRDYDIFHRFSQLGRYIGAFLTFRGSLLWGDASMHLNPSTNLLSILISSEPECTCHLLSSPRAGNNIVYHPSQCHSFSFSFFIFLLYYFIL